jgi:hypothetical protein
MDYETLENKLRLLKSARNKSNMKSYYDAMIYKLQQQMLNMTIEQAEGTK